MRISSLLKIIFFSYVMLSCIPGTREEIEETTNVSIRNLSSSEIEITSYSTSYASGSKQYDLDRNIVLKPNEKNFECRTSGPYIPVGYQKNCGLDSIVFVFKSNNKGYISVDSPILSIYDFPEGKNLYWSSREGNEKYKKINENTYEYTLTDTDAENAFELPSK